MSTQGLFVASLLLDGLEMGCRGMQLEEDKLRGE